MTLVAFALSGLLALAPEAPRGLPLSGKLLDQRTSVINRIHKTLEACNIKLSAVASDVWV